MTQTLEQYRRVENLSKEGKLDAAWKVCNTLLIEDPKDVRALVAASFIMRRMGHLPAAYHFGRSATQLWQSEFSAWLNLGHACDEMRLPKEAESCYRKAAKLTKNDADRIDVMLNLGALYLDEGRFDEAERITREILAANPNHQKALGNLGFCLLAKRDWSGWPYYHLSIGTDWRPKAVYRDPPEPEWDGSPGKTVAIYGDQGLGDEICSASMLPDAIAVSKKVIIDCDDRLEGLFRRSFPEAKVYGTRRAKNGQWAKDDWQIDCSLPICQLGEFFRKSDDDFPGTPYLKPDPDRVRMWMSLFAAKKKPVVGIAWTGGIPKTNARNRRLQLKDFAPVFNRLDAHYVSLQYKDASAEIAAFRAENPTVDLKQYAYATLTPDYDDTAALIASVDYVLCIQTAVAHTAGALGVPVSVLLPVATQWRYGNAHDTIPWYDCLRVIRQENTGSWEKEIERAARELETYFARIPTGARTAPRIDRLRDDGREVRADSLPDH